MDKKLQMSQQCTTSITKVKHVLGGICRDTASRDRVGIIPLHSALARSHLELCVHCVPTTQSRQGWAGADPDESHADGQRAGDLTYV